MTFNVKFRGVRGSYPVANVEYMKYGGNTSCVEVNVGGHLIIIDAGTGLISLGKDMMTNYLASGTSIYDRPPMKATILLSHIHQDHIQGFPFFGPSHVPSAKLNVFGSANYGETLSNELAELLFTKSFPLDLGDIAANLKIKNVNETEIIILRPHHEPIVRRFDDDNSDITQDDVVICCYKSYAHPKDGVYVFKIEYKGKSLVYASDKESYIGGDKKFANFARNCTLLIHDAQYTTEDYMNAYSSKQGFGHSTFEMALEAQQQVNAEKLVFFHFNPDYDDNKLDSVAHSYNSDNALLAFEGLELSLL